MKLAFKYKLSLLGVILAIFTLCSLSSQARREFSKTVKKEFDISTDGTTSIYNKYGKVLINTWDKNRVKVEVMIVVKASGEEVAQAIFDRIDIDFDTGGSYVSAKTQIESSSKNSWWKDNNNKADYSINYEVWMPPSNRLELETKYCDSKVAPLNNSAEVSIKYGNLIMEGLDDDLELKLDYGNGTINKVHNANIESSHCTLNLLEAQDIEIESKYSTITVERAQDIRSDTRYDTYKLGQVSEFRNTGKYDNLVIQKARAVYVDSDYTHFFTNSVSKSIDLQISYGDVNGRRNQ